MQAKVNSRFNRCIILLLDGAYYEVLEQLLEQGKLPTLETLLNNGGTYRRALSVFPSTSGVGYLPFVTGQDPGFCNIPGLRWFDRTRANHLSFSSASFRSYCNLSTGYMSAYDLNFATRTLFELIPNSVSYGNPFRRGFSPNLRERISEIVTASLAYLHADWTRFDNNVKKHILMAIDKKVQLIFAVIHALDGYSHVFGPTSEQAINVYIQFDGFLKQIMDVLGDDWKRTQLIISADHGFAPIHTHCNLTNLLQKKGYQTARFPFDFPLDFTRLKKVTALVAPSGNSMAHVYLREQTNWKILSGTTLLDDMRRCLLQQPGIDIIANRNNQGGLDIQSRRGFAKAKCYNSCVEYQVIEGEPFGYDAIPSKISADDLLSQTFNSEYPGAILHLLNLFRSQRTGDLVISTVSGYDVKNFEIRDHKASHGSLRKEHVLVPFITNHHLTQSLIQTKDVYKWALNTCR